MESEQLKHQIQLPNLFIPGAGKSGTSSFHALLNQHPNISMSRIKEPRFWIKKDFDTFTKEDYNKYADLFNFEIRKTYFGEATTGYMCFPEFIQRIKSHNLNDSKFIFILRNPIDRCYSHYWWLKGIGSETEELKVAFLHDLEIEPSNKTRLPEGNFKNYYQFGLYSKWMVNFYNNFDSENIYFITYENLKKDPLKTLNSCFEFLGLSKLKQIEELQLNKTAILKSPRAFYWSKKFAFKRYNLPPTIRKIIPVQLNRFVRNLPRKLIYKFSRKKFSYPKMTTNERTFLKEYYIEDVQSLKKLVNYNFSEWTDFN